MKNTVKNKRGATLVELLVTFALLSIFLAAAAAVLTPSMAVFGRMKSLSYAQNVSDIVMEKVCGEIAGASADSVITNNDEKKISFSDSQASPIYIKEDGGYLLIHYRKIMVVDSDNHITKEVLWDAVDWRFDKNAYHGFIIKSLEFSAVSSNNVKITLVLYQPNYKTEYTTSRVVECYNLGNGEKVISGNVIEDDDEYYNSKYN